MTLDVDYCRHVAIFGTTGSGKSTTLRTLLAELPVASILWDVKAECQEYPAIHHDHLRIAAYDLDLARYLDATPAGVSILKAIRPVCPTLDDVAREVRTSLADTGSRSALLRAIAARQPTPWIAEPTIDLEDVIASKCLHVVQVGQDYDTQVNWLMSQLIGLDESPLRLVVVFEEAHLLSDVSTAAKLLRSKGVGLIFVTQHPRDLSAEVLGVCNTRIYHRLLVDRYAERTAPMGVEKLGVGEALIDGALVRIVPKNLPDPKLFPRRLEYVRNL